MMTDVADDAAAAVVQKVCWRWECKRAVSTDEQLVGTEELQLRPQAIDLSGYCVALRIASSLSLPDNTQYKSVYTRLVGSPPSALATCVPSAYPVRRCPLLEALSPAR